MDKIRKDLFNILNLCKGFDCGYSSKLGPDVLYIRYEGEPYYIKITKMEDFNLEEHKEKILKQYYTNDTTYIKDVENIMQLERLFSEENKND